MPRNESLFIQSIQAEDVIIAKAMSIYLDTLDKHVRICRQIIHLSNKRPEVGAATVARKMPASVPLQLIDVRIPSIHKNSLCHLRFSEIDARPFGQLPKKNFLKNIQFLNK